MELINLDKWKPKSIEDHLLYQYWNYSKGQLFFKVPIGNRILGNWPPKSKIRRIDGVLLINGTDVESPKIYSSKEYTFVEFFKLIKGKQPS